MPAPVPNFVRRAWRLIEARRALLEGVPERALEHLSDPVLSLSGEADRLRERSLSALYRHAARRAKEGRSQSVARVLEVVAGEDPARAHEWSLQLEPRPSGASAGAPAGEAPGDGRLLGLLSSLRTARKSKDDSPGDDSEGAEDPPHGQDSPGADPPRLEGVPNAGQPHPGQPFSGLPMSALPIPPDIRELGSPQRLHLAVDDGGELFCVCGTELTLGHAQTGLADVPLFADLAPRHVRLERTVSFHGGSAWRLHSLVPDSTHPVGVSGRIVGPEGEVLTDGDEVRLAPKVAFRFHAPEASSSSVRLDLLHGLEAEGAARVLVWAPGREGRVRIGAREQRCIPVAGLEHEVSLTWDERGLSVSCPGGVLCAGQSAQSELRVEWPLARRVQLLAGARPSQPVPFGLAFDPVDPVDPKGGFQAPHSGGQR